MARARDSAHDAPMIMNKQRIAKDIVLVGGGHAHVQVVKSFGMKPEPGVRLTLISPDAHTPYSGMLPGLIAGHYTFDETHIDLNALCRFAGVRFLQAEACGLDPLAKRVVLKQRPPVRYDLVSIDTGSTPRMDDVPGASDFAIPVKPISNFLMHWNRLAHRAITHAGDMRVAVVGAGAGGIEVLLSIQHALRRLRHEACISAGLTMHLFGNAPTILPGSAPALRAKFEQILRKRDVEVHAGEPVCELREGMLVTSKAEYQLDAILWVTAAGAAAWPGEAGLAVGTDGSIIVTPTLQSITHPAIFAAGDVSYMRDDPRPKAGVFAVRQGPYLTRNLRHAVRNEPLEAFRPQKDFLTILAAGDQYGVASRNGFAVEGAWVWRWKDSIDRKFMAKFSNLPAMATRPSLPTRLKDAFFPAAATAEDDMRCGGCGAKIGSDVLRTALSDLNILKREDILIGLDVPDDAAAIRVPAGKVSVHTIDAFRAMITDPYAFGKIAANHALGDIYAMGALPQSALALVTLPPDAQTIIEADLAQMMHGAVDVLNDAGASLVGGHTAEGAELTLGFSIAGLADPDKLMRKTGLQTGDVFLLTKPLGTGALLAADMRGKARGRDVAAAITTMLQPAARAAQIFAAHGASSCTDVTGFGLAGHMLEMLRASGLSATLTIADLPILEGAQEAMQTGIFSTLHPENAKAMASIDTARMDHDHDLAQILFDPQTAGGLLGAVAPEHAQTCLAALRASGYLHAAIIGNVIENSGNSPMIRLQ